MATTASHVWRPSASRILMLDGFIPGPRGMPAYRPQTLRWPAKDPADVLDYQFDIAPALAGNDGDAISTLDVLVSPSSDGDLTLVSSAADGTRAVMWFQGGIPGTSYDVTVMVGTETGRTLSRTIKLPILSMALQNASNLPLTTEEGAILVDSDGNPLMLGLGNS